MQQTFKNIIKEDLTSIYQEIDTTSLIIWGELDDATPLKDAYKINKKIKDSALIVYPKAGHFSYLDYPHLTNKIIKEFLKEKKKPNISSF